MNYWDPVEPLLINTNFARDIMQGEEINVIDGGSANTLFSPFDFATQLVRVNAFDPDPDCKLYDSILPVNHVKYALWNKKEELDLHVAKSRTTSSIYPPSKDVLENFNEKIGWEARQTVRKVKVPSISIDLAIEDNLCSGADFIKLDIHSSEFEALEGAKASLGQTLGVLVETWHRPIHEGQFLNSNVELLLNQYDFFLRDLRKASDWRETYKGKEFMAGRSTLVGTEGLYIKEHVDDRYFAKQLLLLDLFGCYTSALNLGVVMYSKNKISEKEWMFLEEFFFKKLGRIERKLKALKSLRTPLLRMRRLLNYLF